MRNVFQEADCVTGVSQMQKAFLVTQDPQIFYMFQTKINNVYKTKTLVFLNILYILIKVRLAMEFYECIFNLQGLNSNESWQENE